MNGSMQSAKSLFAIQLTKLYGKSPYHKSGMKIDSQNGAADGAEKY